jgi:CheY-like chemotaxis protein
MCGERIEVLVPDPLIVDIAIGQQAGCDLLEQLRNTAVTEATPEIVTSTDRRLLDRAEAQLARCGGERVLGTSAAAGEVR